MADVFLKRVTYDELLKAPKIIEDCLNISKITKNFKDKVALKIHFGEKGNTSHINPNFLAPIVNLLKKNNLKPFLFETNTLYRGSRTNAIDHINLAFGHGFGKLNIPIIIGDGINGSDSFEVVINKKHFKTCYLAQALKDIDSMLVLSHFTGHMLTGFGAAIKNLGMGCASRKGKLAQHCDVSPHIDEKKCRGCFLCLKICPAQAIEKRTDKSFIIEEKCIGCAQCISVCPVGAIDIIWSYEYNMISERIAEYAFAAAKDRNCAYINFCIFMTKECDCMNKERNPYINDLGILFSLDPVSIDKASIDLIIASQKDDPIKKAHPQIDYLCQLNYAQAIGLGTQNYNLIEI
ncbi:MAG: DUF362 domain-containing protein [Candidatus Omnitrophica bacterium]|nr:DUF362 domain-containing protein [Candidatus Omnitrophota bacterium]MCM8831788.1 DUF362 domain-containing protein [Candidatus Omnitrophota bacterium]